MDPADLQKTNPRKTIKTTTNNLIFVVFLCVIANIVLTTTLAIQYNHLRQSQTDEKLLIMYNVELEKIILQDLTNIQHAPLPDPVGNYPEKYIDL